MTPTPEQAAIISAATSTQSSLMIQAYAGCAKTSTLELLAKALPSSTQALALAFNVKIKKELESRFPPSFKVMTMNGLGHNAWAKAIGTFPQVDAKKLSKILTSLVKSSFKDCTQDQWGLAKDGVERAMRSGLVPSDFSPKSLIPDNQSSWIDACESTEHLVLDLARAALIESIKMSYPSQGSPIISFDEQIYLSALFGGVFPTYPLILVDEAQDLSPLNHLQLRHCTSPQGRLIVCGDNKQAIYQFRGADSASMAKIRTLKKEWIDLPLHTTFRCPQVIVQRQSYHAPGFICPDSNPQGQVLPWYLHGKGWAWKASPEAESLQKVAEGGSIAVLCRNNAPLISLAFKLLRLKVGVVMLGRDIGKNLVSISTKILPSNSIPPSEGILIIQAWLEKESALFRLNHKEEKISGLEDRASCLLAVYESCQTSGELRKALSDLFSRESGQLTLSTGHRSKGLEWDTVLHLDPWRIPSKHARDNPIQLEQELNLRYVIETRTRKTLILANLEDFCKE